MSQPACPPVHPNLRQCARGSCDASRIEQTQRTSNGFEQAQGPQGLQQPMHTHTHVACMSCSPAQAASAGPWLPHWLQASAMQQTDRAAQPTAAAGSA
jgi:hypothetical protein